MKKFISVIAILCLLSSFAAFSFADNTTAVYANISAGTFSVSVPTKIDITSSKNGVNQTDIITNTGNLPVKVSSIKVTEENGWTQIDSNLAFSGYKQFKLDVTPPTDTIPVKGTGSYDYTVTLPPQPKDVNEKIATITVTVAVDDTFYAPIEPPIEPSLPQAVSPKLVSFNSDNYYKIAEYGEFSLLLHEELTTDIPNYPLTRVSVDLSGDFSLPIPNAEPTFFDLSSAEFDDYCNNVLQPSNDTYNDKIYHLRDSKSVYNNSVEIGLSPTYHRYAIWVPTSSLPTS